MIRHSPDDNTYQGFLSSRYCFTTKVRSFCVRYYRIRCYSRRIIRNGDQMRLMSDTCICFDMCLQVHSHAFFKVSGMKNSKCCRGMQTKLFHSSDNILDLFQIPVRITIAMDIHLKFEIKTMKNLKKFQNKTNSLNKLLQLLKISIFTHLELMIN